MLESLVDQGEVALRLVLPPTFPLFDAEGTYDAGELLGWFGNEVDSLAAQFDARNGNDYHARWFAERREVKAFAICAPLEACEA